MGAEHVDVLIIGAGISGIGAACHLIRDCPGKTFAILERRERMGGTWDLFRYPGIRSDSDMFTFGYNFRPWNDIKVLADGPAIRRYLMDTAAEYGVADRITYGIDVQKASWSTAEGRWTLHARDTKTGRIKRFTASFVLACTGYYDYAQGYRPSFPGEEQFTGTIVHPQHWPEDLDYRGKRVVVIGSGATAVTLVPAMAPDTAHITMLQRSPTYIMSLPAEDGVTRRLRRVLPDSVAFAMARRRNIALQRGIYALSRTRPGVVRGALLKAAEQQLRGKADMAHFTPRYDPWDERLCVVPNGDLFRTIRRGRAEIVTDRIETFTGNGIRLASGRELPADIVVAATGLNMQLLGGGELEVDGSPIVVNQALTYKAVLIEGVPNAGMVFGYTNASWTLKADLAAEYVCRLINHMDRRGYTQVVARATDADRGAESIMSALRSGYIRRAEDRLPRQGTRGPWRVRNDYLRDIPLLRYAPIDDGVLQFSRTPPAELRTRNRSRVTA